MGQVSQSIRITREINQSSTAEDANRRPSVKCQRTVLFKF